jgi:O-antigen ligase
MDILMFIGSLFNNEEILARLEALATFGSTGVVGGNLESRVEVYLASINTFLEHPFGVGPEYSFVTLENGIGYHSQFLDDLARYGIFGFVFHFAFIVGYYQLLRKQWSKINMQQIALPVSLIYFLFLTLNPGFTSPHEGVLLLFLIPAFPNFIKNKTMESQLLQSNN